MKTTPTERSKRLLTSRGYLVGSVERFVRFPPPGHRVDLFGFIDLIAIRGEETLAVQSTSDNGGNVSAREQKIRAIPQHVLWLASPNRKIVVHGWKKSGPRGKRKVWNCREVEVV